MILLNKNNYINILQAKYSEKLSGLNPKAIEDMLKIIDTCRKKVASGKNVTLDEEISKTDNSVLEIFSMLKNFQNDIKQYYVNNEISIYHITDKSPEEIENQILIPSKSRATHYEYERGDYLFASSAEIKGNNLYLARKAESGMIVRGKICIYGNDIFCIDYLPDGSKRLLLKKPNYCYEINPECFAPVVVLTMNKNNFPCFEFSDEWITEESISLDDNKQLISIRKIEDVTQILENYQIFVDTFGTGEAFKILQSNNREQAIATFMKSLKNGRIRYINGLIGINQNPIFEIENEIEK